MTTQLAGLNGRLVKYKSDKNEAAAGKYILDTYTPKPHDTTRIATLIDYLDTLMQSANELDKMLKCHDGALFLKDSQKLKSGRQCHHLFNEMTIKVCTISFERPVNYLCDSWHVFPPKYQAWTHFNRP